jgi:excinuclease UvrABC nuclease subunit
MLLSPADPPIATQLWLLDPPPTIHPRFDQTFFRSLPTAPGVYLFRGRMPGHAETRVLYVGKAVDLRRRVRSYGTARPGRASRKTLRLLTLVESIAWELCPCERTALHRENELIQELRPPFNRANAWPQGYWYVGLETDAKVTGLILAHEPGSAGEWFGAFKGRQGYDALARCLSLLSSEDKFNGRPAGRWFRCDPPRRCSWPHSTPATSETSASWTPLLRAYLKGESDGLVSELRGRRNARTDHSVFDRGWQDRDLETLQAFFERGTHRNAAMCRRHGLTGRLIPKEQLDRFLIDRSFTASYPKILDAGQPGNLTPKP